ncbi:tetratricopeptide repeat protein [Paucidesulfovibrio longus]|uniref:tetratricopeptide repeat protein n=1 Tax=Paucidesulfovibrio longus TaxID=889 RepID=UPI00041A6C6F|nr:SEL1-like repeat protein [Paucidesulfovibrio longus]
MIFRVIMVAKMRSEAGGAQASRPPGRYAARGGVLCVLAALVAAAWIGPAVLPGQCAERDASAPPGTASAWLAAARAGDGRAQFEIASLHLSGQWGAQDEAQAIYWLQRSAEQGFAPAFLLLTHIYSHGTGLRPPDPGKAALWAARLVNSEHSGLAETQHTAGTWSRDGNARVRLSEEEVLLLQVLRSDYAERMQGAGAPETGSDGNHGEILSRRRRLAEQLNSGLTRQSRWVVDPFSTCLIWFQEPQGDEFVRWDGICDAEGFATGRGTLSFRSQSNGQITRCSGIMNAGIIVEGEFMEGE